MYPTFAKLVAAALFAALAWKTGETIEPRIPQGVGGDLFVPLTAAGAAFLGWRMLGGHARRGIMPVIALGVSTGVVLVLACAVFWALWEVMRRALRGRYGDPVDALEATIEIGVQYAQLLRPSVEIPLLILGSAAIGLLVALVGRVEGR